jgi:hypothetical protein
MDFSIWIAERRIVEAIARGEFDDLPGRAGRGGRAASLKSLLRLRRPGDLVPWRPRACPLACPSDSTERGFD